MGAPLEAQSLESMYGRTFEAQFSWPFSPANGGASKYRAAG